MKKIIFTLIFIFVLFFEKTIAQGCVAIRGLGAFSCATHQEETQQPSGWTLTINSRYFKSYKHFVGTVEQKERVENGTEVINHSFSTDFFLQHQFNKRTSIGFNLPIISNVRSSLYEHGGNTVGPSARKSTHSFGIGDARIALYYWLMDPQKKRKWNVQGGVGIKLPTGDYNYQDYFYKNDTTKILGSVDQSIQLGDGGTGLTAELNGYCTLSKNISIYGNFFYLSNPREQNGVSTARGGTPTSASISYGSNVMSVPDQYMYRGGISYMNNNFSASLGVRKEGIPSKDLIGRSNGFRRPGYVVSVEPGMSIDKKKFAYFINLPIALQRNRTQSVPDMIRTRKTGVYFKGDAAFADYLVNVGIVFKF